MKHVKKMALVPANLAQQLVSAQRDEQQLTNDTPAVQLSSLDNEMRKVLFSNQPGDVKAKQYARLLQSYGTIRRKFISPGQSSQYNEPYEPDPIPGPYEAEPEAGPYEPEAGPYEPIPEQAPERVRLVKSNIPYGRRVPVSPQPSPPTSPLPSDSLPNHLKRNKHRSKPYDRVRSRALTIEPASQPPRQVTPPPPTRRQVFKRRNDGTGPAAKKPNVKYGVKRDHDIELRRGVIKKKSKLPMQPWIER